MTVFPSAALIGCLSLAFKTGRAAAARQALVAEGFGRAIVAGQECRLDAVMADLAQTHGLFAGLPRLRLPDGHATPPLWAEERWAHHLAIRAAQRAALVSIIATLNRLGLIPVLLKGARSLWVDAPRWRAMRDLDILIATPGGAAQAQAALLAEGFATHPDAAYDADFHHEDNLYRADLPGWVEIHRKAASYRGETLLASSELRAAGEPVAHGESTALVLPPTLDLLHNLIHHHFGHWEAYNGRLDLKGLFEFAMAFAALSRPEREELAARAARNSLLLAMLEFWLVAAQDTFGMDDIGPFSPAPDVIARWRHLTPPADAASRLKAIAAEIGPALEPARLRRTAGGITAQGRLVQRGRVLVWAAGAWGHYYLRERWA